MRVGACAPADLQKTLLTSKIPFMAYVDVRRRRREEQISCRSTRRRVGIKPRKLMFCLFPGTFPKKGDNVKKSFRRRRAVDVDRCLSSMRRLVMYAEAALHLP